MRAELENELTKKYPKILKDMYKAPEETCMAFGIECGDGWYDLIENLLKDLQWNTDKNNYPQVIALQIKEKYGSLRFYFTTEETENSKKVDADRKQYNIGKIDGMIQFAETMSNIICEKCGNKGENKNWSTGWFSSMCESCRFPEIERDI